MSLIRLLSVTAIALLATLSSCSTAPKAANRAEFMRAADATKLEFLSEVNGLEEQIAASAGVIVFPGIGEWGSIFAGGRFGRAVFARPDGEQIGWASIQSGSVGLGAGVRRFQMLVVLRDEATVERFMENRLAGDAGVAAVVGDTGGSTATAFRDGVAVYQTAGSGLLAAARVNLSWIKYEPLEMPAPEAL